MTRQTRFLWWTACVAAAAAAPVCTVVFRPPFARAAAAIVVLASLTAMIRLLLSTPRDAIRLPWGAGVACLAAVAVWLPLGLRGPSGWMPALAAAFAAAMLFTLLLTPRTPVSPWWAAPVIWSPGLWASFGAGWTTPGLAGRLAVVAAFAVIYAAANGWARSAVWALWGASAALAAVSVIAG
ncbi:MAG: hypothetical protein IBJ11_10970 [Phycisphaerales bacterium]|nr:hypothetical protein [Phycisphaerales bacterium]